jgi:hypothetical protein
MILEDKPAERREKQRRSEEQKKMFPIQFLVSMDFVD